MINPNTRFHNIRAGRLATLALAAAGLVLAAAPMSAQAQAREMLNRLVQSTSGSADPAGRAFVQGRSLIDDQKWEQAASTFDRFVAQYPTDKNVDAALYWLAYAHSKQGNLQAAGATLDRLLQNYARSTWADDARALRLEVRSKLNPGSVDVPEEGADDLKIIALRALCENDKAGCSARVSEVLRSGASPRLKEAAIILLGRYGGAEAVPTLMQMSRGEADAKLRMRAIRALGATNDERALEVLREIAMGPTFDDESPTDSAIHALVEHASPRAVPIIGDVAINGKNLKARTHTIELVSSRRRGDDVVDQLFRVYDAAPEVQVKKYVLAGLGNRKDPRAMVRLSEVARTAGDVQLRSQAVRTIAGRGEGPTLDLLLPLYDSERDNELKDALLHAFGLYQDQRAYQKLMQVVRNNAEPIERRKTAITMLSKSKDPQVQRFLEEMIK